MSSVLEMNGLDASGATSANVVCAWVWQRLLSESASQRNHDDRRRDDDRSQAGGAVDEQGRDNQNGGDDHAESSCGATLHPWPSLTAVEPLGNGNRRPHRDEGREEPEEELSKVVHGPEHAPATSAQGRFRLVPAVVPDVAVEGGARGVSSFQRRSLGHSGGQGR